MTVWHPSLRTSLQNPANVPTSSMSVSSFSRLVRYRFSVQILLEAHSCMVRAHQMPPRFNSYFIKNSCAGIVLEIENQVSGLDFGHFFTMSPISCTIIPTERWIRYIVLDSRRYILRKNVDECVVDGSELRSLLSFSIITSFSVTFFGLRKHGCSSSPGWCHW